MKPIVVSITAPSAAGKSVLQSHLLGMGWSRTVSTTSRTRRPGEVNGIHYHFVSDEEFQRRIEAGGMLEWIQRGDAAPAYYGTGFDEIQRAGSKGRPVVMVLDPAGMRTLAERDDIRHVAILLAPTQEMVLARLAARYAQDDQTPPEEIAERIKMVVETEMGWIDAYRGMADLVFPAYSETTEEAILTAIVQHVEEIHELSEDPSYRSWMAA